MTADCDAERQTLSKIVGEPIVAFERRAWGFENRTDAVTLADGRRLIVQRIANRALAHQKLRLARILPERLAAAGIRAPRLLAGDASADPPYAVREYVEGEPGPALLETDPVQLAAEMGALLPRLALVPTGGAALEDTWADPARLASAAREQLERCRALFEDPAHLTLAATIDEVVARFAGRAACFAHGDFCPVNVLLGGGQVVTLLDVEAARLADPLFDAAWWGWVVRYHHPDRWAVAWPALLASAGIADDDATRGRIRVLQRLRCLELADQARSFAPDAAVMWARRLGDTIGWDTL